MNGPDLVYVERNGLLEETDVHFRDAQEVMRIIDRIVAPLGRRVDESSPMVDARLPDGSRVNVIIPPLSLRGPCISIRKFARTAYTLDDLVRLEHADPEMGEFLQRVRDGAAEHRGLGRHLDRQDDLPEHAVRASCPDNERIITIEDAAELQLQQQHVLPLEARPPNVEGKGQVTIRQLVINCLRMRPDRIVVGEVRGGEALDMLQAMNTGHDGSLTTAHSNSPRDTLAPRRDDGADGRHGPAAAGRARADRVGLRPDRPPRAPDGRHPPGGEHIGSAGNGRRCHRHAGYLPFSRRASRPGGCRGTSRPPEYGRSSWTRSRRGASTSRQPSSRPRARSRNAESGRDTQNEAD